MSDEMDCDVCAGTGQPVSGLPCICGGSGSNIDEKVGLRNKVRQLELQNDRMRNALEGPIKRIAYDVKQSGILGEMLLDEIEKALTEKRKDETA